MTRADPGAPTALRGFEVGVKAGDRAGFELWHWAVALMEAIDAPDQENFRFHARGLISHRLVRNQRVIAQPGNDGFSVKFYHFGEILLVIRASGRRGLARGNYGCRFDPRVHD